MDSIIHKNWWYGKGDAKKLKNTMHFSHYPKLKAGIFDIPA
jgi:hypothetical protein